MRPVVTTGDLDEWCQVLAGEGVEKVVFESGYSSAVAGVDLVDGRRVVVKARPWNLRLLACSEVQRVLFARGFTCPRPLHGPMEFNGLGVTIEEFVAGEPLLKADGAAAPLAAVLAELVRRAPAPTEVGPLRPHYGFLQWPRGHDRPFWPATPEVALDLNDARFAVRWIDALAAPVAARLEVHLPLVIGHGDWWSNNIRWLDGSLSSVDDWDSVVALPEAAIAGIAAALFNGGESTLEQSEAFLDAYAEASGALHGAADREVAWAAGLWARLVDAKKGIAVGRAANAERLHTEVFERAARAGSTIRSIE